MQQLEKLNLDKIIFMPAGSPPHKKSEEVLEASFRYNMVYEAIKNYEDFEISNYEISKEGYSYTYETLENFKSKWLTDEKYFDEDEILQEHESPSDTPENWAHMKKNNIYRLR